VQRPTCWNCPFEMAAPTSHRPSTFSYATGSSSPSYGMRYEKDTSPYPPATANDAIIVVVVVIIIIIIIIIIVVVVVVIIIIVITMMRQDHNMLAYMIRTTAAPGSSPDSRLGTLPSTLAYSMLGFRIIFVNSCGGRAQPH
jgi:hypothetical protein